MKRILLAVFAALSVLMSAMAQNVAPERGMTTTAMFALNQRRAVYATGSKTNIGFVINPRIGYRFNPRWEAGGMFRYEKANKHLRYYGIGGYGEYSFFDIASGWRLFVDMQAYHSFLNSDFAGGNDDDFTEVGFTPGVAYHIGNSLVDLKLRYLFVGFNNSDRAFKTDSPGCLGRNNWILDASLRRLEIGLSVSF